MSNPLIEGIDDYTINSDFPLRPAQQDGVEFLLSKFNAILAHQTGLGKTYSALTACQHIVNYSDDVKVIIICPKKANTSFEGELNEKIIKQYSIYATGNMKENDDAEYFIFNHSTIHKYEDKIKDLANDYNLLGVIDEAHILQSRKSRQSKVLRRLRGKFNCVFGLTATPLLNHEEKIYNIVNYFNNDFFLTYKSFEKRYLVTRQRKMRKGGRMVRWKEVIKMKNKKELAEKLKQICQVRSKEYDLDFHYRRVDGCQEVIDNYYQIGRGLLSDEFGTRLHDLQTCIDNVVRDLLDERLNTLERKIEKISKNEKLEEDVRNKKISKINYRIEKIKQGLPELNSRVDISNKEKLLLKTVKEILKKDQGTLIYVDYQPTEDRLMELFDKYDDRLGYNELYRITGRVNQKKRDKVEEELDRRDVVILSEAGSESIDLDQVNNLIFYDTPFAIGTVIQVIGRITRMNTDYDKQNVYFLEVKDTIDTYKRMLIQDKANLIKELFGGNSNLPSDITKIDKRFINQIRQKLLWKFK